MMVAEETSRKRSNPPQKKPLSKRKDVKIIGVLILVIGLVAVTVYAFYPKNQPNENLTPAGNPIAVFDTTLGTFKVELFEDKMPITVENFVQLVDDNFYDGMIFYRISDNFMIQAGRYFSDGTESFSPYGNIQFETSDVTHVDGAISMASTAAKAGGSAEFFICDGPQSFLDGNYAAFGVTIEGIDVVRTIAGQQHDNSNPAGGGKPLIDIIINSITIE